MATREVQIVSTTQGSHFLLLGFDSSAFTTFYMQLWIEKFGTRAVDWLQAMSLSFSSFVGGNLYLHNSDEVPRCNLFGEQKEMKIGVVANQNPTVKKILDSIGIHTDSEWEIESLVIPADQNHPDGMSSLIPKSFFKKREGILYSEFLRNMKTSSSTVKAIEALTGEPLRGGEAYMVLKNTSTEKVQIWAIDINMTASR